MKNVLKNFKVTSQCCNNVLDDDDHDEWRLFLIKRIDELEKEYDKCKEHQRKVKVEIDSLSAHLARMSSVEGPSTSPRPGDK